MGAPAGAANTPPRGCYQHLQQAVAVAAATTVEESGEGNQYACACIHVSR